MGNLSIDFNALKIKALKVQIQSSKLHLTCKGVLQQQTEVYQASYNLAGAVLTAVESWCLHRQAS